ncbi:hypothetical protein D5400_12095 [Georhizobium profundi]|uniref:Uncharacterized protein n=1 Tax=Georhizobium profundi TaxID=2341112 RepID=A0A3Q8XP04_9HYPH|nr:hypothetical protein D5400_12095 [Georhizobium profundi]
MTEHRLTAELIILLASWAAEEVVLGSVSAYAGGPDYSDSAQANDLAMQMEMVLGLSSSMPLLHLPATYRTALLTGNPDLAERIHQRLHNAYEEARGLIDLQREAVSCMVGAILRDRPLEGTKFQEGRRASAREALAMKIWILSNLHLEVAPLLEPLAIPDADVCVIAGDLCRGVATGVRWLAENVAHATRAFE